MTLSCIEIRCAMVRMGQTFVTLSRSVGGDVNADALRHILRGDIKAPPAWIAERIARHLQVPENVVRQEIEDAAGFGWTIPQASFDWATMIANKDKEIDRLNKAYIRNLEGAGAELVLERATVERWGMVRIARE